jgi:nucleoside-diphosphate-sugar epimerase
MIFYNGATGSLGQYFGAALARAGAAGRALRCRLEDRAGCVRELQSCELARGAPVFLVQMAAKVSVPACESDPLAAHKTNVLDTLATVDDFVLFARARGASPHVLYVSSGHVYAPQPEASRIAEDAPVSPRSAYARSKLNAERALEQRAAEWGYPLLVARVFGLLAPRQPANYLLPGLIRRVRSGDLQNIPGLSFHRDYLDARDVCEHLVRLCTLGFGVEPGQTARFNVCSGQALQIRELVVRILALLPPAAAVTLGEAAGRPDDIPWIVGNPRALEARLGVPARRIQLIETLRDALQSAV